MCNRLKSNYSVRVPKNRMNNRLLFATVLLTLLSLTAPTNAISPVSLTSPIGIRGLFLVGQTLKIVVPADTGVTYQYKWYADSVLIEGATSQTFEITSTQNNKTISAAVVASKTGYSNTTFDAVLSASVKTLAFTSSNSTIIDGVRTYEPYCNAVAPHGSTEPQIGWNMSFTCQALNTSFGAPSQSLFQWYRNSSAISGSTSSSYNLVSDDANSIISATNKTVFSNSAVFLDLQYYATAIKPEVLITKPTISGSIGNGNVLSAVTAGSDSSATLTYQWFRNFLPISGATNQNYTVSSSDLNKRIQVLVTGTRSGYTTSSRISDAISSGALVDPTTAIYDSIADFTPSNFNPDITYVVSSGVNQTLLNIRKAELEKAADFWHNEYVPIGNHAMYLTENDGAWADAQLHDLYPNLSANTQWWITTFDCGYAYASRFSSDYFFQQCLKTTSQNRLEFQQITPHEYTHWVQYSQSQNLNTPATPWLIEGQANFYGLALGVASEDVNHSTIDLTLAQHATAFDDYFQKPWSTQEVLQMLKSGNVTDVQTLFSRSGTATHSYLLGTLLSEWLVYEFGHDVYWNWVKGILSGKAATSDNGVELTATLTQTYFGMPFSQLARNAIPYLAMRATQLEERWQDEINPDSPPGPPTITSAVAGNEQVTLYWTDGENHGAETTGYRVYWGGSSQECSSSPCTITGLTNGSTYAFNVVAISTAGDSAFSNESGFVTPSSGVLSTNPPTNVNAIGGDGKATISWSAPSSGNQNITGYVVFWDSGFENCDSSPCVVDGLDNGTDYSFAVKTVSSSGESEPSEYSQNVVPAGKPIAPSTLKVTAVKAGQIIFSWSGMKSNGASISKYEVSWKLSTAKSYGSWIAQGKKTSATIKGWKKGKSYSVRIRVTNAVGQTTSKVFTVKQTK